MLINKVEILLVEDNAEDAELTTRALKKNNLATNLVHVKDGEEALEFIFCTNQYQQRDIRNQPKVVLLDLNMPKVGGMQVLEKIKSDDRTKAIPVVILTSSKEDPNIERCYKLGANSYIVKPVDYNGFLKAVGDLGTYWIKQNEAL
jgi:two-component system response regulator